MKTEQKIKVYSGVVTAMLVLSAGFGLYYFGHARKLADEQRQTAMEMDSLVMVKAITESQLTELQRTYEALLSENKQLQGHNDELQKRLLERERQINQIKKQSARTIEELRNNLAALQDIRRQLDQEIAALREENERLRAHNQQLTHEVDAANRRNQQLSQQIAELQEMVRQENYIASPQWNASAFRVEVEKRNDKLTAKGRKAREVIVSFDLIDLPRPLQGTRKLYLTITDAKGTPITGPHNQPVELTIGDKTTSIVAQQIKQVALGPSQRIAFVVPLEEKLQKGLYKAMVYTDDAWVGTVSFRLD